MDKCPDVERLLLWLNGKLDDVTTTELRSHVTECDLCRQRLEELTDETSLSPPSNSDDLTNTHSFTDEPHFRSLRARISEKASKLIAPNDTSPSPKRDGDPKSLLPPVGLDIETVNETGDSTFVGKPIPGQHETAHADPIPLESPDQPIEIAGYLIESLIGRGGFANVYQAWDKQLQRAVAIKVLSRSRLSARNRMRFVREAKIASSIQSPNVVQVFGFGPNAEPESNASASFQPYIVMELVQGKAFARWIEERSSQGLDAKTIEQGVRVLVQVGRGAQAAHDAGLVHRDIKPGNVFLNADNSSAKLGDFGLARLVENDTLTLTQMAELAGTPAYMSPEQTLPNGKVDKLADVYSLGATLYQTLTGQPPFRGSSLAILKQIGETAPIPPSQLNEAVTSDLETVCLKALEKDPANRYATASLFVEDLESTLAGRPIKARPISSLERLRRWTARNRRLATTVALLFLTLLVGTIVSTTLWIKSDFHAKRSAEHAAKAIENRTQLATAVKNMVSANFTRKSSFLNLSEVDRRRAIATIRENYLLVFDGGHLDDENLIREMTADLIETTDVNLELMRGNSAASLLDISWHFVDQQMEKSSANDLDRLHAATVYYQLGEFYSSHRRVSPQTLKENAKPLWQREFVPDVDNAVEAYQKAMSYSESATHPTSDMSLQQFSAKWRLTALKDTDNETPAVTKQLLDQLASVAKLREQHPELSAKWMELHQRMLLALAKRHQGKQNIDFRIQRRNVLQEYLQRRSDEGFDSYWYDRIVAVNESQIGIGCLQNGEPVKGKSVIADAEQQFKKIVAAFPQSTQFGADLAELEMIQANIAWVDGEHEQAIEKYLEAIETFGACLKADSNEVSIRRRLGTVHRLVATRYVELDEHRLAESQLKKGIRQFELVIQSGIDPESLEADQAILKSLQEQLETEL